MAKPFKFRFVNEIVGFFVLIVVAALVAGIILAGRAQEWFIPKHRVHVDFPVEGSLGLQKGAQVRILGWTVGRLEEIRVSDDGRMSGELIIKGDFIRFVRLDSEVLVKKMYEIAGEAFIEITQGQLEPLDPSFNLSITKGTDLTDLARDLLTQVEKRMVPALEKLERTVDEYGNLAADLRSTNGPLMKLFVNLERITAGLERGEGSAGLLLKDPSAAEEIQAILKKASQSMDDVKKILAEIEATTRQLPPMAGKVGQEIEDLPGLVLQTKETIREAERLIEGIQKHWLIRNQIPQPQPQRLIAPSEVGSP